MILVRMEAVESPERMAWRISAKRPSASMVSRLLATRNGTSTSSKWVRYPALASVKARSVWPAFIKARVLSMERRTSWS